MVLIVRKAQLSDIPVIVSLWRELANHHARFARRDSKLAPHLRRQPNEPSLFAAWARKQIRSRNGAVYLALMDGKPIGYSLVFIKTNRFNPEIRRIGFIDHLHVTKQFRGRRISSALTGETIAWFRAKGIRYVSLNVLEPNRTPQAIYRKWGFFPFAMEMRKNL